MQRLGYESKLTGEIQFGIRGCIRETFHYIFRWKFCNNLKDLIEACTWTREE